MNKPGRYGAERWAEMNTPEGLASIRSGLRNQIRTFLDTASENKPRERVQELLVVVRQYFENELVELEDGAPDDIERIERTGIAEHVIESINTAIGMIPTDESERAYFDALIKNSKLSS
jgi:hypothetical protein